MRTATSQIDPARTLSDPSRFLPSCSWLMLSAMLHSRIRAPIYSSTALARRAGFFLLAFFIALLIFNELEKAIALNGYVAIGI